MSAEQKAAEQFVRQCEEAGEKITSILFSYPKAVAVCVLPGVLASVMKVFSLPREMVVAMIDSAIEDLQDVE